MNGYEPYEWNESGDADVPHAHAWCWFRRTNTSLIGPADVPAPVYDGLTSGTAAGDFVRLYDSRTEALQDLAQAMQGVV